MSIVHTADARVLSLLRTKPKSRYQIQEMLGDSHRTDNALNKLLEHLYSSELIEREGILYTLSKRGQGALQLIDMTRNRRAVLADDEEEPKGIWDAVDPWTAQLMKRGRVRATSDADLRPAPARVGSNRFLDFPSRFGNTLRYRDGRVTDMAGNPIPTTV